MRYIALEKNCAREITEQGLEYSGNIKGILSADELVLSHYADKETHSKLHTGCFINALLDDGRSGQITFTDTKGHKTTKVPVVFSLPIQGLSVKLLDNNTVEFDIECSNDLWKAIVNSYRNKTIDIVKEELGIDVSDILPVSPLIIDYVSSKDYCHNTTEAIFEEQTKMLLGPRFGIFFRVEVDKDHRHLLSEIYEKRSYLFSPRSLEKRQLRTINLTENDNEIILTLGTFFGPSEKIPLVPVKEVK